MCEMHIQLCVVSVELETNTRMILYDFTQWSSIKDWPQDRASRHTIQNFLPSDKIDPILMH